MINQNRGAAQRTLKLIVVGTFIIFIAILSNHQPILAQSPQVVGAAPAAQTSLEYVGKIDQAALSFNGYGYLTAISGVPANMMFTDLLNHSEATARFTYVSSAHLTGRSVLETLFVLNAAGTTTVYYNDKPQADFKDPASFGKGVVIATGDEHWQTVVNVQAPDTGIVTGLGEYTQTSETPFTLNGVDYVLGNPNQFIRYTFTGEGKRSDKVAPNSTLIIAGYATAGGN